MSKHTYLWKQGLQTSSVRGPNTLMWLLTVALWCDTTTTLFGWRWDDRDSSVCIENLSYKCQAWSQCRTCHAIARHSVGKCSVESRRIDLYFKVDACKRCDLQHRYYSKERQNNNCVKMRGHLDHHTGSYSITGTIQHSSDGHVKFNKRYDQGGRRWSGAGATKIGLSQLSIYKRHRTMWNIGRLKATCTSARDRRKRIK